MGKSFAKLHICAVGQLEDGDKIPRWVRANGGEFHRDVDERCTHLIATQHAYKHDVEAVKKAKDLGTVKIVSFDWLEDSLLQKSRRPKPEMPYLLETILCPVQKSKTITKPAPTGKHAVPKAAKKSIKDPFDKKPTKGARSKAKPKFQVYEDPNTGERWSVVLARPCKSRNSREKYQLAVFETVGLRRYYPTYAKYSRTGVSSVDLLTPAKSDLGLATTSFKKIFKLQTGKEWEERDDGKRPHPKMDSEGNILPTHEGWYTCEDDTSIFTKFIMEARPTPIKRVSAPEMADASNNGVMDSVTSEDSCKAIEEDMCVDGDEVTKDEKAVVTKCLVDGDKVTNQTKTVDEGRVVEDDSGNEGDLESCADDGDDKTVCNPTNTETEMPGLEDRPCLVQADN